MEYTNMTELMTIESEKAPKCLLDEVTSNQMESGTASGTRHHGGFGVSTYLLPTPRAGIELIDEEEDELMWHDSDSFEYDGPGTDFIHEEGGIGAPLLTHYSNEFDHHEITKGIERQTPLLLRSLIHWMTDSSNFEGLTFTKRGVQGQPIVDPTRSLPGNMYSTIGFEEAPIHGTPPVPSNMYQSNGPVQRPHVMSSSHAMGGPATRSHASVVSHGKKEEEKKKRSVKASKPHKTYFGSGIIRLLVDFWFLSAFMVFVPLAFAAGLLHWSDAITFSLNFLAIVPMAWLIGQCTEDVASKLGQVYGGLVNAWMGNVVEMVLVMAALKHDEIVVVRATLIGSILSNILLVAGCSFFFGGLKYKVQEFNSVSAGILCSLLMLSILCLGLPTVYNTVLDKADADLLNISRVLSFFLIIVYGEFMFFQLHTHAFLFQDDDEDDDEDDEYLSLWEAVLVLCITSVICAICSEYLVRSINGTVKSLNLSKEFIGIILLPIIGNAAEHYTAVVVACKNKMDLSVGCAIGSSVQMALLVTPFSVLAGWTIGVPMTLDLHPYELMVLLASILTVQSIISDGKTNWLEGSLLITAYLVIAIIYYLEDPKYSDLL